MLIESRSIVSSLFISTVILFLAWIAALVGKSEAFENHVVWWRRQRLLKRAAVVVVLIGFVAFAGTKPSSGGGADGGDDPAITNVVEGAEGEATLAIESGHGLVNESGEAVSPPPVSEAQGKPPLPSPRR